MSKGRRLMSVFALAAAVLVFGTTSHAQETKEPRDGNTVEKKERKQRFKGEGRRGKFGKRGMRGGPGMRGGMMRGLARLDLTETQRSQVELLVESHRTTSQPLRDEARALIMKKRDGTLTEGEEARLGEIREQMKISSEQLQNSVLVILTPEQLQKLEQMKAERRQRMEQRRERREFRRQQNDPEKPAQPEND